LEQEEVKVEVKVEVQGKVEVKVEVEIQAKTRVPTPVTTQFSMRSNEHRGVPRETRGVLDFRLRVSGAQRGF